MLEFKSLASSIQPSVRTRAEDVELALWFCLQFLLLGKADSQQFVGVELMEVREIVVSDIEASAENRIFIFEVILKFLIKDFSKD